jgi:DNA polymerase III epsilon subunit-like protein
MIVREIVIDTETTALDPLNGDRVVEIGAVELIDRSRVASGRMSQQEAERQIALMNEIADNYRVRWFGWSLV